MRKINLLLGVTIFCFVFMTSCVEDSKHVYNSFGDIPQVKNSVIINSSYAIRNNMDQALVELLSKTVIEHMTVVDNVMVIGITREEFVILGIPERYYDQLLGDIDTANRYLDSIGVPDKAALFEESYKDFKQSALCILESGV